MIAIVFLVLFGLIILGGIATTLAGSGDAKAGGIVAIVIGALLFGLAWITSSVFYVEAREVGIVAEFGKATSTANTGLNWDTPWSEVTKFSTANQPLDFDGDEKISFKLTNKDGSSDGEAWVNLNLSWQVMDDDKAIKLWEDRKEFERVKNEVVLINARSGIVGTMGAYTPEEVNNSSNIGKFNEAVTKRLNEILNPKGIKIEDVAVTKIDLSDKIKDRLEKKNADKVEQERAVIQQQTAITEAETNRIKQGNLNELVIANNCLEITNSWDVNKNGPLPAGWTCAGDRPTVVAK